MSVCVLAQGYNCQQLVQIFIAALGRKNNITYTHLYGQIDFVYLTNVFFCSVVQNGGGNKCIMKNIKLHPRAATHQ